MVASGAMTRSTDECEMSRSCHSATFSMAGTTAMRTSRARPVRFSDRIGLRLCGIAEDPFCFGAKNSCASSTSVRCMWRISTATFSTEEATTPSAAKKAAWRSRGITCVEIGSGFRPILAQTCASTLGSTLAKVPTAPEIAPVAISSRAASRRRRLRCISAWKRAKVRPMVTGSAWIPWLRPMRGVFLCSKARSFSASSRLRTSPISRSAARVSWTARQVSSTSEEVMP